MIEIHGLKPKTQDPRDFKLGAIYDLPKLSELPEEFVVGLPIVLNQKNSDFCAAFASCAVSELQEGEPLYSEWAFAKGKELEGGDVDSFGLELRTICKVHTKFGVPGRQYASHTIDNKPASFLRRIENYPDLLDFAKLHKKQSFVSVTGPYDHFDNMRASVWKFRDEKRAILFGILWGYDLSDVRMKNPSPSGFGHALAAIGFTKDGLYIHNSAGEGAGEKGRHYFSREVINSNVEKYGAYMYTDVPREEAEYRNDYGIKDGDSWAIGLLKVVKTILFDTFNWQRKLNQKNLSKRELSNVEKDLKKAQIDLEEAKLKIRDEAMKEKLAKLAESKIGVDASPRDLANDAFGCAESVSTILGEFLGDFPIVTGTYSLFEKIKADKRFKSVLAPTRGTVGVCVSGLGNGNIPNGHCWVFKDNDIAMSNNSATGKWDDHWTLKKLTDHYVVLGGYQLYLFDLIG